MGNFAKVVNGKVVQGIVAELNFFETFVDSSPGIWLQTSYNTRGGIHYDPATGEPSIDQSKALRKNFAGIGYDYDADRDAFIPPKPTLEEMENPVLDEKSCLWINKPKKTS